MKQCFSLKVQRSVTRLYTVTVHSSEGLGAQAVHCRQGSQEFNSLRVSRKVGDVYCYVN